MWLAAILAFTVIIVAIVLTVPIVVIQAVLKGVSLLLICFFS